MYKIGVKDDQFKAYHNQEDQGICQEDRLRSAHMPVNGGLLVTSC